MQIEQQPKPIVSIRAFNDVKTYFKIATLNCT